MATKKTSTTNPETDKPTASRYNESPRVAPQFVDKLVLECEDAFADWLSKNATPEAYQLWNSTIWLRGYVMTAQQHDGHVAWGDNHEVCDIICDAINAAVAVGAEFFHTAP